jgi:hypothetical protein
MIDDKMKVYLAVPYTPVGQYTEEEKLTLRHNRFMHVSIVSAYLLSQEINNFSPITHSHVQGLLYDLPQTWPFWRRVDFSFLEDCNEIWVLMLDGWELSVGVQSEIAFALAHGIPIRYIEVKGKTISFGEDFTEFKKEKILPKTKSLSDAFKKAEELVCHI